MAGILFDALAINSPTESVVQWFRVGKGAGKLQMSFMQQVTRGNDGHGIPGTPITFRVYESDTRQIILPVPTVFAASSSSSTAVTGLTSGVNANFAVGDAITGTNIAGGTTIAAIPSPTTLTLSQASTGVVTSMTRVAAGAATNIGQVIVVPGGQDIVAVATSKQWLLISGIGSGYSTINIMFNGIQYFGSLDVDSAVGKSGFGLDNAPLVLGVDLSGGTYDNREGNPDYSAAPWPEV